MSELRHALLLTAGLGTRLRPLTLVRAKPAIPVGGEPLVRRITRWLTAAGITDLVLNLHHLPATLTAVMGDGSDLGVRARYSWEQPLVLGSAGGPRQALPLVDADTFLIANGDTLTDADVDQLAAAHAASGALVTLALTPNREPLRYGGVRLDSQSRVTQFVPRGPAAEGSFHFIGVQVAKAAAFQSLPMGQAVNSIGGAYDRLIAERPGAIGGFVSHATFWDIGTTADYWRSSLALTSSEGCVNATVGTGARIDPSARITQSILWDDVEIGADAVIEQCIVTDRVQVPPGARHRRAILRQDEGTNTLTVSPLDIDELGPATPESQG